MLTSADLSVYLAVSQRNPNECTKQSYGFLRLTPSPGPVVLGFIDSVTARIQVVYILL